jgi:Protein of unknown function (DUF1218)
LKKKGTSETMILFSLSSLSIVSVNQATVVSDSEKNYSYCVYDSDISTGYGVGALFLLLVSQVIIIAASRCFCCGQALKPGGSRACALILFLFCWYFFYLFIYLFILTNFWLAHVATKLHMYML